LGHNGHADVSGDEFDCRPTCAVEQVGGEERFAGEVIERGCGEPGDA
jgi:hypothetical protein